MSVRVAINGFGRMGRLGFRAGWDNGTYDIVHINEIAGDAGCMAHLLEFDSVHGRWNRSIAAEADALTVDGKRVGYSRHAKLAEIDWSGLGVDLVIDCTGKFKTEAALQPYFDDGVKKVLVSAPMPSLRSISSTASIIIGTIPRASHRHRRLLHHQLPGAGGEGHARRHSASGTAPSPPSTTHQHPDPSSIAAQGSAPCACLRPES